MKRRNFLSGLGLILAGGAKALADKLLITDENKNPKWVVDTETGETESAYDFLQDHVDGAYVEGGDDPTPPPPPSDDVTERLEEMSTEVLKNKREGEALAFLLSTLSAQHAVAPIDDLEKALNIAIGVFSTGMEVGDRYKTWLTEFKKIVKTIDGKALTQAVNALVAAYGLDMNDLADVGASLATGTQVNPQIVGEAVDIELIITLILQVLQILRNLGIISKANFKWGLHRHNVRVVKLGVR